MLVKKQNNKVGWIALIILVVGAGIFLITKINFAPVWEWVKNIFNGIKLNWGTWFLIGTLAFIAVRMLWDRAKNGSNIQQGRE